MSKYFARNETGSELTDDEGDHETIQTQLYEDKKVVARKDHVKGT